MATAIALGIIDRYTAEPWNRKIKFSPKAERLYVIIVADKDHVSPLDVKTGLFSFGF